MSVNKPAGIGRYFPYVLFLFGFACFGYGIYIGLTNPSSKIVSRVGYDPFPEFLEKDTYQISIYFQNLTNQRIRVVGVAGC